MSIPVLIGLLLVAAVAALCGAAVAISARDIAKQTAVGLRAREARRQLGRRTGGSRDQRRQDADGHTTRPHRPDPASAQGLPRSAPERRRSL